MSPSYRLLDVLSRWRAPAKGRWTCLAVVGAWLLVTTAASAQVPRMPWRGARPGAEAAEETPSPGEILPRAAHETVQRLAAARKAAQAGEYAQAATILQSLLAAGVEDGFVAPADGDATQTTLRREVRRLLETMPAEGRRDYQSLFGPQAQSLLKAAVEDGDRRALARIADEYFHTQAGYQAVMLLAYDRLDRGEPREAIYWLRRIGESPVAIEACEPGYWLLLTTSWLAAGDLGQAHDAFARLRLRCPEAKFGVGQRRFVAERDQAEAWAVLEKLVHKEPGHGPADSWTMFRGDAARNAAGAFNGKLGQREWDARLADGKDLDQLRSWRKSSLQQGSPPLSAIHALVVGNTVLARSPYKLVAVDFVSGRRTWEFPWETPDKDAQCEYAVSAPGGLITWTTELVCRNASYGQLSSDGRLVFLLDRLAPVAGIVAWPVPGRVAPLIVRQKPWGDPSINRLVALDTQKEGRLAWFVGGEGGEDEPKLAGAFFLGPPLVDGPRLYVLAEIKGEIVLCQLHAATGRLAWSQMIAHPVQSITADQRRRLAGATPSLADGVLVCPTSAAGGWSRSGPRYAPLGLSLPSRRQKSGQLGRRRRDHRRRPRAAHPRRFRFALLPGPAKRAGGVVVPPQRPAACGLRTPGEGRAGGPARGHGPRAWPTASRRGNRRSPAGRHMPSRSRAIRRLSPTTSPPRPKRSCKSTWTPAASPARSKPRRRWATWSACAAADLADQRGRGIARCRQK